MLPLKGIRVLDLSRVLAGPYCSMLLGDMGAEIIKIEDNKIGDETRSWGPPFVDQNSIYFWAINRNKSSVCVDFKHNSGQQIIRELAKKSDVLIENFIPGTLNKYSLHYDSIKKLNKNLVYCSISGYGQEGPMANQGGYDILAAGIGGLLHITGPRNGPPCRVGVPVTDMMTGMTALVSVLAGLISRINNGGCYIDCNLLSTQISMLSYIAANYLTNKIETKRTGTEHSFVVPYQAFLTSDNQYFLIGAGNDNLFKELCSILKLDAIARDERFLTNPQRVINRTSLIPIFEKEFSKHDLQYWLKLFNNSALPHGPVNNMEQVFSNEQVKFLSETLINSWQTNEGTVSVPGFPVKCSAWNISSNTSKPPKLGEHTRHILNSVLEYTNNKIDELFNAGVIYVNN